MVKDVLSDWSGIPMKKKARKLWLAAPLSLLWAIWKKRNIIVFEDKVFSPTRPKLSFVNSLISWVGVVPNVDCSITRILMYPLRALIVGVVSFCFWPFLLYCFGAPIYFMYTLGCSCSFLV